MQFKSDVAGDAILRRAGNEKKQMLREKLTFLPPKNYSKNSIERNLIISSQDIRPTTSTIVEENELVPNTFLESIEVFPGQKHAEEELAVTEASDNPNFMDKEVVVPIETSKRTLLSKKNGDNSRDKIAKISKPIMKRKTGEKLQIPKKVKLETSRAFGNSSPRKELQVQNYLDVLNALPLSKRVSRRKNFEPKVR